MITPNLYENFETGISESIECFSEINDIVDECNDLILEIMSDFSFDQTFEFKKQEDDFNISKIILSLNSHVDNRYPLINDYLNNNNIKVSENFAESSSLSGIEIDEENINIEV